MASQHSTLAIRSVVVLFVATAVVLTTVTVAPVAAHESEEIDGYELTFGGTDEPVITGERMWLMLQITDEDGEPVPDQADALQWRVENPGNEDPVELEVSEKHGEPGVYEAAVVFTEPGEYTVHMEGMIDGTEIHPHFEKEVVDHTSLEYPASNPDGLLTLGSLTGLGIGVAIGAIGAIGAFLIGRRV